MGCCSVFAMGAAVTRCASQTPASPCWRRRCSNRAAREAHEALVERVALQTQHAGLVV
jgi:hypothetical protein